MNMDSTPPPITPNSPDSPPPLPSREEQSWAIALHLSGFAGLILPAFGQIIAPLIIWLIKRAQSPLLDQVGKNVLNFQISFTIYALIAGALSWLCIGLFILPIIGILWIVFMIIAAVKTSNGESYTYPLSIQFLR